MSKMKDWIADLKSAVHIEVTLRIGVAMLLGYIVVFSDIMPIDTHVVLGILVPFCSMLFPSLTFAYGSLVLPLFGLFIFVYVSSSLLLAVAVAGGKGAFLAMFGVWSFWVTFLRWDKSEGFKTSVILISGIFQTVLVWPNYLTVIDGFFLPNPNFSPAVRESLEKMIEPAVQSATAFGPGTHFVEIVSGGLKGQSAKVTINAEGTLEETFIEGGMWIVTGMWTSSGIRNPLASYQIWMVFSGWLILILGSIYFIPPVRTIRSALCAGIIPAALRESANSLRLFSLRMESPLSVEDTEIETRHIADNEKERMESRSKLNTFINTLFEGNLAKLTVYEPRLLALKPPECTMEILVQLCVATSRCLRIATGIDVLTGKDDEYEFLHKNRQQYENLAAVLDQCAHAISSGDISIIDRGEKSNIEGEEIGDEASSFELKHKGEPYDPFELKIYVSNVVALTRMWLQAMGPINTKTPDFISADSLVGLLKNFQPWVFAQISHVIYLIKILTRLCNLSTWKSLVRLERYELQKLLWCFKYAVGFTTLLAMSMYWPAYQENFVISAQDDPNRKIYSFQNGGWAMASYCFATTQTTEGSIKKGILRMVGTITGAFSAWLALLACEDDRYSRKYNVVGIISWMTVTSIIATYVSTERGFSARIELSNQYAFGPIYFLIAQIIIVCNAFYLFGPEGRDAMVINRMFSNLVGIIMSMVISLIPLGNWGGDPGHCRAIVQHHWRSTTEAIRLMLSCDLTPDGEPKEDECKRVAAALLVLRKESIAISDSMQALVVDFEKDAVRLNTFPLFKVDPKLKAIIARVTRDVHIAAYVPQVAARILLDPQGRSAALSNESRGRRELNSLYEGLVKGSSPGMKRIPLQIQSVEALSDDEIDLELLLRVTAFLRDEIKAQEKDLDQINWGVGRNDKAHSS